MIKTAEIRNELKLYKGPLLSQRRMFSALDENARAYTIDELLSLLKSINLG